MRARRQVAALAGAILAALAATVWSEEVTVVSQHAWFGDAEIGHPSGAGTYPYGSAVTVSVDRIVLDPENPGRRLRLDPPGAGERAEVVIPFLSNSTTVVFTWTNQFAYAATTVPCMGWVEGTPSGWYDGGTVVSNLVVPYPRCPFVWWENVPAGCEQEPCLTFSLDGPYTNVFASIVYPIEPLQLRPGAGTQPAFELQAWRPARIQRYVGSLTNADWEDVGAYGCGTTNWNDIEATGQWRVVFYRLVDE